MTIQFTSFIAEDTSGITLLFSDGFVMNIDSSHPNYSFIVNKLTTTAPSDLDEKEIKDKAAPIFGVGDTLTKLSDRVIISNNLIYFDGDVLDNGITQHILRIIQSGEGEESYGYLVKFLDKITTNPSPASVASLYDYVVRHGFTIAEDGDFLAYKGVNSDGTSRTAGFGVVDGVVYEKAHLPNKVGSVVEIPRSKVDADARIGCSTGLHAGTHEYASSFARGLLLLVKINPRDVVSVPEDANYQKLRVCRYTVIKEIEQKVTTTTYNTAASTPTPDVAKRIRVLEEAVADGLSVTFDYIDRHGVTSTVTGFAPTQLDDLAKGHLATGELATGEFRSYYAERITSDVTVEDDDYTDNDGEPRLSDYVGESVYLAFDYTTRDGNVDKVASFLADSSTRTSKGVLVKGFNKAGEHRAYYQERVNALHENPSGDVPADDTEDSTDSDEAKKNAYDFGAFAHPFGTAIVDGLTDLARTFSDNPGSKLAKNQVKKAVKKNFTKIQIQAVAARKTAQASVRAAEKGKPFDWAKEYDKRVYKETLKAKTKARAAK